jgi:hypothetical protein
MHFAWFVSSRSKSFSSPDGEWSRRVACFISALIVVCLFDTLVAQTGPPVCSQKGNRRRMELCEPVAAVYRVSAVPD